VLNTMASKCEELDPEPLISVVMPCLNEEATIGSCIEKIQLVLESEKLFGEIIVCDNGSSDLSVQIAESLGVKVVHQPLVGYGHAYMHGISSSNGRFIVMGDADNTYDFNLIPVLLKKLQDEGKEFVTGSRFLADGGANIKFLHRYIGNPAMTWLMNFFFGTKYSDVCCGLRAFSRSNYERIAPVSTGMEYNLELAINAGLAQMSVCEVATKLGPRQGESKLNTFVDGWRSLRLMLFYCPDKVFLYPAALLLLNGLALHVALLANILPPLIGLNFAASVITVVSCQSIALGMIARTYSWSRRFSGHSALAEWLHKTFHFEKALACGVVVFITGATLVSSYLFKWLPQLPPTTVLSLAASLLMSGASIVGSALVSAALSMPESLPDRK